MDLFDRIYELDRILRRAHTPVSRAALQERLECSRATVGRIISEARACIGAPIEYDHRSGGYRYAASEDGPWELPGLWFNASELYALLAAHHLLANAQPGLLEGDLTPLLARIERILAARGLGHHEAARRIRILRMAARRTDQQHFRTVAGALVARRRLLMRYHGRARDAVTQRQVSPQRLTHYRENWYLDAWDHGVRALRSFSVDRIQAARVMDAAALDVPERPPQCSLRLRVRHLRREAPPHGGAPVLGYVRALGGGRVLAPRTERALRGRVLRPRDPVFRLARTGRRHPQARPGGRRDLPARPARRGVAATGDRPGALPGLGSAPPTPGRYDRQFPLLQFPPTQAHGLSLLVIILS